MKDLHATVRGTARQAPSAVYAFLADFSRYPAWYPSGVKTADLTAPDRGRCVLALTQGPIQRDFDMEMAIETIPESSITLRRLPKSADDREQLAVTWRLEPRAGGAETELSAEFAARLSIPGWLPLGGVERAIPQGFLDAALAALNR
ncbi:SRPBCC family protein [Conexibacter sp. DBS9H8]|uniref:SRPBCC family protein n=1 Tax=Conexibacter sp. DBS9H8 TaxID=2937801 RepID=UPI00200ECFCA|nr:SRPBCC family protein [Conexibacter sp. DBS9H8]